jgi:hypothetical protein
MARVRLGLFAGIGAFTMLAVVVSCSLGLDESKITAENEGGPVDVTPGTDAGPDSADGAKPDSASPAATCAKDEDCVAPNACAKGRCDLLAKRCIFDVCRPMACNTSTCDSNTKACAPPAPYKFNVTKFQVGVPAQRMVAVYPWLFVQTATGVIAFSMANPAATAPAKVTISKLGFVPAQMVATANRVFFMYGPAGPANLPTSTLPIAYVDVPADPFVETLEAKSALATFSRPGTEPVAMLPRENDTVLIYSVTAGGPTPVYNATVVEPPFVEPVTFTTTALLTPAGVAPANLMSGTRFIMQAYDGAGGIFAFGLVSNAGTAMQANGGTYSFADAGPHGASQAFAMGPGGALYWSSASLNLPPNNPDPASATRAARAQWLFANGTGDYDRASSFDIELYNVQGVPFNQQSVGPAALLDPDTALVVTAARENPPAQTAVQVAKRNPLGIVKDGTTPRRAVLPIPIGTFVAAAGANGIGYAVANETMPTPNATVYVFAPDCVP